MKTRNIINKRHMETLEGEERHATANARVNQKNLKSSPPCPAPSKTPIRFGGVETGIALRALGNHPVLPYKTRRDIHLPSAESLGRLWAGSFITFCGHR